MKKALIAVILFATSVSAQVTINQATPPAVFAGATTTFTATVTEGGGVTWSCPGCKGSVNANTGVYTAPATIHAQQSYAGYQLLPNDHIYNTRVDSLPVNPSSASWISGAGTIPFTISLQPSFPVNYMNNSTPTSAVTWFFTPDNNGNFQFVGYPFERVESGWFQTKANFLDRHEIAINEDTGIFQEVYGLYPNTSEGGSGIHYANSTYTLPNGFTLGGSGGSTDAAGLYLAPLILKLQEMEYAIASGGSVNHALRMTLQQGFCASSIVWPATSYAFDPGVVPFGARFRLKSTYDISHFSATAQIVLTTLKRYGLILADGGTGWATQIEYTKWPDSIKAALTEIDAAFIAPSNFEAVDESGLRVTAGSGVTTASEAVVATGITNPSHTAKQYVVLTGVTVGLPNDIMTIQAGTGARQLVAYVNGSANLGLTWSMSPSVGTLTGGGLYTPPANIGTATTTTVTVTSQADSSVYASMQLSVLPTGTIRLLPGKATTYTDTGNNVWYNHVGTDAWFFLDDVSNAGPWPNSPDIDLYESKVGGNINDMRFDIYVPNGSYSILEKFATEGDASSPRTEDLEAQGNVQFTNFQPEVEAGGDFLPIDKTLTATVTTGLLSVVFRNVNPANSLVSAIAITSTGSPSSPSITTMSLPADTQNVIYNQTVSATGGTLPYTFQVTSGSLPTGTSMNSSGVISGTPTVPGTSNFTVTVTDANSQTAMQALSILVNAAQQQSNTGSSLGGGITLSPGVTIQ